MSTFNNLFYCHIWEKENSFHSLFKHWFRVENLVEVERIRLEKKNEDEVSEIARKGQWRIDYLFNHRKKKILNFTFKKPQSLRLNSLLFLKRNLIVMLTKIYFVKKFYLWIKMFINFDDFVVDFMLPKLQ